jgi:hypothetical protein
MPQTMISFSGNVEQRPDNPVEVGEGCLRASMQPVAARGDHQGPQINTEIEPASDFEILVEGEDHADRRAEELVVAHPCALCALEIALGNTEQAIHVPADFAAAAEKGFAPINGIIIPFALIGLEAVARDRVENCFFQPVLDVAGNDTNTPGLGVAAAGAAGRELEQCLDGRTVHRRRQERPHGLAGADGLIDRRRIGRCFRHRTNSAPSCFPGSRRGTTASRRRSPAALLRRLRSRPGPDASHSRGRRSKARARPSARP